MRYLLALCVFSLAACGGDSTNDDTGAGGLDGMPLAQLEELGLECEGGMYPDLRRVEGDLCVPDIPEIDPLIDDCKLIAEAGCLPVALGCGYMATAMSLAVDQGLALPELDGYSRQAVDTQTVWVAPDRDSDALLYPAMGDDRLSSGLLALPSESHDCIRDVRPEMSELGQWVWRDSE